MTAFVDGLCQVVDVSMEAGGRDNLLTGGVRSRTGLRLLWVIGVWAGLSGLPPMSCWAVWRLASWSG